jgi:nicotinamide-nucleotide amidase
MTEATTGRAPVLDTDTAEARAAILVTGSEILIGRTLDTNSGRLARFLDSHGVRVERVITVDDDPVRLRDAFAELVAGGYDIVCTTGGLGPTHDDRTVELVGDVLGLPLQLRPDLARTIDGITEEFARRRGVQVGDYRRGNDKQATVPEGARILGPVGTAPGLVIEASGSVVIVLPGPPSELTAMLPEVEADAAVAPILARFRPARAILRTFGVPESRIGDLFMALGGDEAFGTETSICASRMEIEVTIRARTEDRSQALADALAAELGDAVYVRDDRRLEQVVVDDLVERSLTVSFAESCTGGLLASRLVNVDGVSSVFHGAIVAYSDAAKQSLLGVSEDTLARHGAVSAECARELALGARDRLGSDFAVSVTGVAGRGGGTADKPVGTVFLHVCGPDLEIPLRVSLRGDRQTIREWTTTQALHLLRRAYGASA